MNKSDLIKNAAENANIPRPEAKRALEAMVDLIAETLSHGDRVNLKGFGSFQLKNRAPRKVRNLHTAEMITVPAVRALSFKPGKHLKTRVAESAPAVDPAINKHPVQASPVQASPVPALKAKVVSETACKPALKRAKVVAVTSGKGGTGKTNFVINTAIALAQRGLKVYVIDADLGTANVDVLLGLHCRHTINSLVEDQSMELADIMVEGPEGIRIIPGGSGLQSLAELSSEELARIIGMFKPLESAADVILIDTGSGISRNVVDFAVAADEVVVVVTPEPHSISDAYAIIKVISTREMRPPIKLVINLVDNINEARLVSAKMIDVTGRFLNLVPQTIGHILKDENLVRSVKMFKPIVLYNPLAPASRCIIATAEKLIPLPDEELLPAEESRGFFGRLINLFSRPLSS
jgi:flagellar biosynthesis protein FlhG